MSDNAIKYFRGGTCCVNGDHVEFLIPNSKCGKFGRIWHRKGKWEIETQDGIVAIGNDPYNAICSSIYRRTAADSKYPAPFLDDTAKQ